MNQKGQALVETALLSMLTIVSITLTMRLGLIMYLNIALDELVEMTHLCELQKKSSCQGDLSRRLKNLNLKEHQVLIRNEVEVSYITVKAEAVNFGKIFEKESELKLELLVP